MSRDLLRPRTTPAPSSMNSTPAHHTTRTVAISDRWGSARIHSSAISRVGRNDARPGSRTGISRQQPAPARYQHQSVRSGFIGGRPSSLPASAATSAAPAMANRTGRTRFWRGSACPCTGHRLPAGSRAAITSPATVSMTRSVPIRSAPFGCSRTSRPVPPRRPDQDRSGHQVDQNRSRMRHWTPRKYFKKSWLFFCFGGYPYGG